MVALAGCAGQGTYMMWNQDTEQRVECRKSAGAGEPQPGYDRSLPLSCIAACLHAGFAGDDPALERRLAAADLGSLSRLGDSEIPFLCRGAGEL